MNEETKKLFMMLIHGIIVLSRGATLNEKYIINLQDAAKNAGISIEDLIADIG